MIRNQSAEGVAWSTRTRMFPKPNAGARGLNGRGRSASCELSKALPRPPERQSRANCKQLKHEASNFHGKR
ncbi:hypothetical protein NQ318_013785 [Aromia moschata]|uniref:Uncharacterized protein n=1 Tax=Aromia moschata TaxID=1265417 RepID=A0AAV8ZA72_9CUCU|nr:hypothetical protein NQ318_013785 [Aromia moschata]